MNEITLRLPLPEPRNTAADRHWSARHRGKKRYYAAADLATLRVRFPSAPFAVVEATATVTLRNEAPSSGLPDAVIGSNDQGLPPGTNVAFTSFYTPFGLREARLGGQQVPLEYQRELGHAVYSTYIEIPPGEERTLELDLFGVLEPGADYRLLIGAQPLVNADDVRVRFRVEGGWEIARSRSLRPDDSGVAATSTFDLDAETVVDLELVQP